MKKNLLLFLGFLPAFINAQQSVNPAEINIPAMEQKAHEGMFRSVMAGAANTYDITYNRCEWYINPAVRYIKGAITTHFKPTVISFNQIEFDLDASFTIDSVKFHGMQLTYVQLPGSILRINLPSVLPVNIIDSISVHYQGVPPNTGFGSFVDNTHGTPPVPVIWTLSEPFGARDWWPCKQDLNDKIDSVDVIVTCPQAYRAASNGVLLSEMLSGTDKIYHWKTRHRIAAYLVAFAVTNYVAYSDYVPLSPTDSIEVLNYVYPESLADAQSQTPDIINVISLYDSLTIVYPFADEKYGHAQFGWGGGMEHQTMSFVVAFNHSLLAHECAHQWFGDHITCGSWQDIWLNEGFATYFEGLTEERYFPSTWYTWKHDKIVNITSNPGGSVLCDDTTSVGRIFDGRLTYNKGSYLLHMLRWKMGDSLFFLALKNYLNTPGLAANYAKTQDLKAVLEATSGQNLTNFFNQWYYGQGYPSYQVAYGQSGSMVTVKIDQTQSHPSVSFYEMPVPVKFIGTTQDTTIVFNHTFSGQTFTANIAFPVSSAQFDPELWILSNNNTIIGIEDHELAANRVDVYPNPATDHLTVMLQLKEKSAVTVGIYDVSGRKVRSENITADAGKSTAAIDISALSAGVYEVRITGTAFSASQKIVKK
ncbi:MAG: aminopeptidase [Bacteroidetes bacterium]|nr:aminopeptidase [Bacteroidota bacterium]